MLLYRDAHDWPFGKSIVILVYTDKDIPSTKIVYIVGKGRNAGPRGIVRGGQMPLPNQRQ
ncbi:hypothetical protein [Hallella absiana]|uniref:hypothetical protein n=1 Tax=Hallella absiana TaxID=2925336 RepID=UPI0021C7A2FD